MASAGGAPGAPEPPATAAEEVAGLDRVLTRLAVTDDDKLEKVLQRLIPAVVGQLKSPHDATRKKVLEILSHVNKRLKVLPSLPLPLGELVGMYTADTPPGCTAAAYGMVRNFALVYAEMAAERAPGAERLAALPGLLTGISRRPAAHQAILLRIASSALEFVPPPPVGGGSGGGPIPGLPPSTTGTAAAAAAAAATAAAAAAAATPPPASPGGAAGGDAATEGGAEGAADGAAAGSGQEAAPPAAVESAAAALLRTKYPYLADEADREVFLSYGLKLMLYAPRTSRAPATPLAAGQAAAAGPAAAAAAAAAAAPPPPPGLSVADAKAIEEKGAPSADLVAKRKLGLLNLVAAAAAIGGPPPPPLPVAALLPLLLAAAVDPAEAVSRRAEELLKRSAALDSGRPAADLESPALVRRLLSLFHGGGTQLFYDGPGAGAAGAAGDAVATPAGPGLRSRLAAVFCRSVVFANTFPASLLTIQECVMPPQLPPPAAAAGAGGGAAAVPVQQAQQSYTGVYGRLRQQGLELCVWVFKHAARHQLKAMGPVVLQGLLDTLDATAAPPGAPMDTNSMTLRGFAYQAIGSLAQRVPELLRPRIDIARRFFTALSDEPPGVRAAVAEATGALSRAFVVAGGAGGQAADAPAAESDSSTGVDTPSGRVRTAELDELLLESVRSSKDAVRSAAVQWACRLFPFAHVPARWVCVLAAGDNKHEIREAALRGLSPPGAPASAAAATTGATGTPAAAAPKASGAGAGALPSLPTLLRYVRARLPRLRSAADPLAALPLPPRSCLALIALLRACRHATAATAAPNGGGAEAMDLDAADGDDQATSGSGSDLDPDLRPQDPASVLSAYACALEAGMCRVEGSSEVAAAALEALLEAAAEDAAGVLGRRYAPRAAWLRGFLAHTDARARTAAAKLLAGHVAPALPDAQKELLCGLCLQVVTATAAGSAKQEEAEGCMLAVGLLLARADAPGGPAISPAGAFAAVNTLTAVLCGPTGDAAAAEKAAAAASAAAGGDAKAPAAGSLVPILRATAALALSYSCAVRLQPALLAAAASDGAAAAASPAAGGGAAMEVDDKPAAEAGGAAASGSTGSGSDASVVLDLVTDRILDLVSDKDAKVASRAAAAAGFLAGGWAGSWDPAAAVGSAATKGPTANGGFAMVGGYSGRLLEGLFATASNKSEDVQFAVGEALAWAFGGVPLPPSALLRANFTSLADSLTARGEAEAEAEAAAAKSAAADGGEPEAKEARVEAAAAADGAKEGGAEGAAAKEEGVEAGVPAPSPAQQAVVGRLLGELVTSPRGEVRCAGAVWLVSLLGFCEGAPALRGEALPKIQEALGGLLGDPNDLTQEMASRGVSLVYRLGDEKVREQLVGSLVAVLQGGGAGGGAGRPVKLTGDTQIFEEGALGSAPGGGSGGAGGSSSSSTSAGSGGGLSTYKELCALATDLGQPDLIYRFMDLAHHAAALNSKRGAAFGFAGIARMAAQGGGAPGAALTKHLAALVPKLFRYTHDPNPKVAEAMAAIWRSLVDDPRATLEAHFPAVMSDLLKEMGGRLWRNRQAAAGALAELLQGRRWPELAPYFAQIWSMTLRGMDDIKDSVRRAALALARTVRGLTLRLADPAHTPPKDCAAAVAVVLPILLEQGLTSSVVEVRALSVEVLGLAAKAAPPSALRPLLGALVPALLEALSSLEDVRLNYVEQHAERLGLDSERLEGARVAAARASPLGDTLDLAARLADGPSLEALVPALVGAVKRGVGLNTKVGTARFIRSMATRPGALGGGGGPGGPEPLLRAHAGPLLRALSNAVRNTERSGTVRKAYASAAAAVVRHAGDKRADKFVMESLAWYTNPDADVDSRLSGGLLLRELLRSAPDLVRPHDAQVLPAAFGAKMDEDKEVAGAWEEIWEEGVSSEPAALRLYGGEICTTLVEMLGGQQWGRKKAAAEAAVAMTKIAPDALGKHSQRLASSLLAELAVGRLWEGKEALLAAAAAVAAADPAALAEAPGHGAVVAALLAAAGRKKASYRTAALSALEPLLAALPSDHYAPVAALLLPSVRGHCEASASTPAASTPPAEAAAGGDAGGGGGAGAEEEPEKPLPLAECLACLAAGFAKVGSGGGGSGPAAAEAVAAAAPELAEAVRGVLAATLPWQSKLPAANAAAAVAQRCSSAGVPAPACAALMGPLLPPLLASAADHKVQQFRLACLAAMSAIATAAGTATGTGTAVSGGTAAGWSEADRATLLPAAAAGLAALAEADKSAAVAAAAMDLKSALDRAAAGDDGAAGGGGRDVEMSG
ncbi:hypothetical protein HYH03_014048 [Edaphochlamys debaryana]|uniref:Uncharacterized protein n=1 Tax=Edaphochlamys debaryana TaxID=47281 RepID=A0A836BSP6_9CHLO|nr:hypothetical protein HYH03_014048 [Edaphochlamys debaryana]|eukprot:KAG2487332.1 hypothetical protein HYH03_014048 [Edaphochlamys debaryana]